MTRTDRRRGATLVELMVIIGVIIVLLVLLVSFVQHARRSARRLQCASNLRQVGLGLIAHLSTNRSFPNAGTFGEPASTIAAPGTDPLTSTIAAALGVSASPAFAGAARQQPDDPTDYGPLHSWVVEILPWVDIAGLYDDWDRTRPFDDTRINSTGSSNFKLSQIDIGLLRCPDDLTVTRGRGNLSYVVNGGFARWWAVPTWGWSSTVLGGHSDGAGTDWSGSGDLTYNQSISRKTGVMFLGTHSGNLPWDAKTTLFSIVDGTANTVLATENQWVGYAPWDPTLFGPNPGATLTSWATPHPNFCMFVGSDKICGTRGKCLEAGLGIQLTVPQTDGPGWRFANHKQATYLEYINAGNSLSLEGHSPFPNSGHSGGVNVVFCDGAVRFVTETIDGAVWAKLLTPQGSTLPYSTAPGAPSYRQLPTNQEGGLE